MISEFHFARLDRAAVFVSLTAVNAEELDLQPDAPARSLLDDLT